MSIVTTGFQDKSVAVLGLGRTGLSVIQSLKAGGAFVYAWDENEKACQKAKTLGASITKLTQDNLQKVKMLVLSPGIPHTHKTVVLAKKLGLAIINDIELLFLSFPNAVYAGITGTNGKSTTTALIHHILQQGGVCSQLGGNIGVPVLNLQPPQEGEQAVFTLELSSYQLESIPHIHCTAGILLNISPDHLAHHGTMENYVAAKKEIFNHQTKQDIAIISLDDSYCRAIHEDLLKKGRTVKAISTTGHEQATVFVDRNRLMERQNGGDIIPLLNLDEVPFLKGLHNAQNMAGAFLVGQHFGLSRDVIIDGMKSFKGLAHRQQHLINLEGVLFVNDSKATNIEATQKALMSYENIYWIAGGREKKADYSVLKPMVQKVRHAYFIGEARQHLASVFKGALSMSLMETLNDAVISAFKDARKQGSPSVILLSPACSSFDQYPNFEKRGEDFINTVQKLQENLTQKEKSNA